MYNDDYSPAPYRDWTLGKRKPLPTAPVVRYYETTYRLPAGISNHTSLGSFVSSSLANDKVESMVLS